MKAYIIHLFCKANKSCMTKVLISKTVRNKKNLIKSDIKSPSGSKTF